MSFVRTLMNANSICIAGMVTKKMLFSGEKISKSACLCTHNSQMPLSDGQDLIIKQALVHRKKKISLPTPLNMQSRVSQFTKILNGTASIARVDQLTMTQIQTQQHVLILNLWTSNKVRNSLKKQEKTRSQQTTTFVIQQITKLSVFSITEEFHSSQKKRLQFLANAHQTDKKDIAGQSSEQQNTKLLLQI